MRYQTVYGVPVYDQRLKIMFMITDVSLFFSFPLKFAVSFCNIPIHVGVHFYFYIFLRFVIRGVLCSAISLELNTLKKKQKKTVK